MDGITAVTARISEIRALLHPAAAVPPSPRAAGTASAGPSFADALALAAAPTGPEPLSVPALKARHSNGRIPADALAPIGDGGHRLAAPAAAAFLDLRAAARRDGVTIGVTDSYRSFDAQVDVARRKGLYSRGGLAAQPARASTVGGLPSTSASTLAQAWMRANAGRFGFAEDTPREPWHWAYKG